MNKPIRTLSYVSLNIAQDSSLKRYSLRKIMRMATNPHHSSRKPITITLSAKKKPVPSSLSCAQSGRKLVSPEKKTVIYRNNKMKITFICEPRCRFIGIYWEQNIEFCCPTMGDAFFSRIIYFNNTSGTVRILNDDDLHIPISFCPFCGISVQLVQKNNNRRK